MSADESVLRKLKSGALVIGMGETGIQHMFHPSGIPIDQAILMQNAAVNGIATHPTKDEMMKAQTQFDKMDELTKKFLEGQEQKESQLKQTFAGLDIDEKEIFGTLPIRAGSLRRIPSKFTMEGTEEQIEGMKALGRKLSKNHPEWSQKRKMLKVFAAFPSVLIQPVYE